MSDAKETKTRGEQADEAIRALLAETKEESGYCLYDAIHNAQYILDCGTCQAHFLMRKTYSALADAYGKKMPFTFDNSYASVVVAGVCVYVGNARFEDEHWALVFTSQTCDYDVRQKVFTSLFAGCRRLSNRGNYGGAWVCELPHLLDGTPASKAWMQSLRGNKDWDKLF